MPLRFALQGAFADKLVCWFAWVALFLQAVLPKVKGFAARYGGLVGFWTPGQRRLFWFLFLRSLRLEGFFGDPGFCSSTAL